MSRYSMATAEVRDTSSANARGYLAHEACNTIGHRERRQVSRARRTFKAHLGQRDPKCLAMHQGIEHAIVRAIVRAVQHGDWHRQRVAALPEWGHVGGCVKFRVLPLNPCTSSSVTGPVPRSM